MLKNSTFLSCLIGIFFLSSYISGAAGDSSGSDDTKTYYDNECALLNLGAESCYLNALDTINKSGVWESFKPFANEIRNAGVEQYEQEQRENRKKEEACAAAGKIKMCGSLGIFHYSQLYLDKELRKHHISKERALLVKTAQEVGIELIDKKLLAQISLAENFESGRDAFIAQKSIENNLAKKELLNYLSGFKKVWLTQGERCGYQIVKR